MNNTEDTMGTKQLLKLSRSVATAFLSILLTALFTVSVRADMDASGYVFVTKNGKVWHAYRDCAEIVDNDAWAILYSDAKKLRNISGECSKCKANESRPGEVNGATYLYNGSFSTDKPVHWTQYWYKEPSVASGDGTGDASPDLVEPNTSADNATSDEADDSPSTTAGSEINKGSAKQTSKKTTTSSGSSGKTTSSSTSSDGYKELMTERQRKNRFWSKTNPKMGKEVTTPARPSSAGFEYADFGKLNNYNSKNNLGGTPIYLLGTVMDIKPVKEKDGDYKVAVMVNDCDGYQWYMRVKCSKAKYELMKNEIFGKAGYIYGTYAGYSGVTQRPMMDMTIMIEVPGNAVNMAIYQ